MDKAGVWGYKRRDQCIVSNEYCINAPVLEPNVYIYMDCGSD